MNRCRYCGGIISKRLIGWKHLRFQRSGSLHVARMGLAR